MILLPFQNKCSIYTQSKSEVKAAVVDTVLVLNAFSKKVNE